MLWIWLALGLFLALALGTAYFSYRVAFYSPRNRKEDIYSLPEGEQYTQVSARMHASIRRAAAFPFQPVTITAFDGITLYGRYYHLRDGAPLQIQFHGYRGSGLRDFCGGLILAQELGHNALIVDQRAHGRSGGTTITFGVKERRDCLSWIEYALQRFGPDTKVLLSGISMGAATVLMAAQFPLPDNVAGIIADSPYTTPGAIIRKVCTDAKLPARLLYPFILLSALLFGRFRLWDASAVKAVAQTRVPILLIHGEDDRFVPIQMSRELFDACASAKTLHTFPDAGHGLSFIADPARYRRITREFVAACGVPID